MTKPAANKPALQTRQIIIIAVIAALAGMFGASLIQGKQSGSSEHETAMQRVLRTGTLRCGYASWEPMVIIDPNTRTVSGIAHDVIEEAAKKIGVKVEWTEESGWGEFAQALNGKRFDAYCVGLFPTVPRERVVDFTIPITYSKMTFWTQESQNKFDNHIDLLNQPSTRFVFVEGAVSSSLIQKNFPKATYVSLPEMTPITNIFQELVANKVDIAMIDNATANGFMKKYPGQIKGIKGGDGYRVYPNTFAVAEGEYGLQQLLNSTLDEMQREGITDQILDKYEPLLNTYYRIAKPYTTGDQK